MATLGRVLELLHLVAGVSYYKAAAPPRLVLPAPLGAATVDYVTAVYTKGLAEYAYRNQLPHVLELRPEVPAGSRSRPRVYDDSDRRPLSAVGGGKDSIVSLEALRRAELDPVPFSVNPNHVIVSVNEASGLVPLAARRRLDPVLFDLNAAGALNGHIPVTAINSLIAVATAVLHGLGPVVMSNERSASDPNLVWNGHEINHQWSKGVEAEGLLRAALAEHAGLTDPYFSLLRSLSELHIARLFAEIDRYDDVVTSCNPRSSCATRVSAGAVTARSAGSSSWPWRRSCPGSGSSASSAATCWPTSRRSPATGSCWAWTGTSRSSASARSRSRWWRSACSPSRTSGATPR